MELILSRDYNCCLRNSNVKIKTCHILALFCDIQMLQVSNLFVVFHFLFSKPHDKVAFRR